MGGLDTIPEPLEKKQYLRLLGLPENLADGCRRRLGGARLYGRNVFAVRAAWQRVARSFRLSRPWRAAGQAIGSLSGRTAGRRKCKNSCAFRERSERNA